MSNIQKHPVHHHNIEKIISEKFGFCQLLFFEFSSFFNSEEIIAEDLKLLWIFSGKLLMNITHDSNFDLHLEIEVRYNK